MSGAEATRHILRELPTVRIVALSMHTAADMSSLILKAGAAIFLSKDAPTEHLIAAIRGGNESGQDCAQESTQSS
jgi:DNA-binding NarL/FixJ family response regulator